jgi:hypothetical protein
MIEDIELWGSMLAPHSREHFNISLTIFFLHVFFSKILWYAIVIAFGMFVFSA